MEDMKMRLEALLLAYAGDNVGADCGCDSCDKNRQPLRDFFTEYSTRYDRLIAAANELMDGLMVPVPPNRQYELIEALRAAVEEVNAK